MSKTTGLKKNAQFAGGLQHRIFIEGLTPEQADELQSDLAEAIAPIVAKFAKHKHFVRVSRLLECEAEHQFMDTENYCVTCNIVNRGSTASAYLKSKRK